jgi:hypothetical protein
LADEQRDFVLPVRRIKNKWSEWVVPEASSQKTFTEQRPGRVRGNDDAFPSAVGAFHAVTGPLRFEVMLRNHAETKTPVTDAGGLANFASREK